MKISRNTVLFSVTIECACYSIVDNSILPQFLVITGSSSSSPLFSSAVARQLVTREEGRRKISNIVVMELGS